MYGLQTWIKYNYILEIYDYISFLLRRLWFKIWRGSISFLILLSGSHTLLTDISHGINEIYWSMRIITTACRRGANRCKSSFINKLRSSDGFGDTVGDISRSISMRARCMYSALPLHNIRYTNAPLLLRTRESLFNIHSASRKKRLRWW